jgi:hypothetical protein
LAPAVLHVFLPPVFAQQPKLPEASGSHIFRRILHDLGCTPLTSPQDLRDNAENKVMIALGRRSRQQLAAQNSQSSVSWETFLVNGGSLLFASDQSTPEALWDTLRVTITRGQPEMPGQPEAAYLDGMGLFIRSLDRAPFSGKLHRIAAIRPGFLRLDDPPQLRRLAELPDRARIKGELDPPRKRTFAAGTDRFEGGKGRVLILADHSVFANALLWQPPKSASANDNFEFAQNCADWLTEYGKRKEILFYEDGTIVDDFYTNFMEDPAPPLPPIEDVVHAINQGLSGIEEEDRFTTGLDSLARQVDARTVIIAMSVLLAVYGLIRLGRAKYHLEPGRPLLETSLTQLVPSIDVAAQRQRWMLRHGNFAEAAQTLGRQFFEHLQTTGLLQPHAGEPSAQPPRLISRQGFRQTWKRRHEVRRLWQIAYAELPKPISARQLAALQTALTRLRQDFAQGMLQFPHTAGPPSPPPGSAQIV